jgi:hypothetical protein
MVLFCHDVEELTIFLDNASECLGINQISLQNTIRDGNVELGFDEKYKDVDIILWTQPKVVMSIVQASIELLLGYHH